MSSTVKRVAKKMTDLNIKGDKNHSDKEDTHEYLLTYFTLESVDCGDCLLCLQNRKEKKNPVHLTDHIKIIPQSVKFTSGVLRCPSLSNPDCHCKPKKCRYSIKDDCGEFVIENREALLEFLFHLRSVTLRVSDIVGPKSTTLSGEYDPDLEPAQDNVIRISRSRCAKDSDSDTDSEVSDLLGSVNIPVIVDGTAAVFVRKIK